MLEEGEMMPKDSRIENLELRAWQLRLELIKTLSFGKAHHFGGSLSCAEIISVLFFDKMNYSAGLMESPERDRFIMSKGHAVPTLYIALSMLGIIPAEQLKTIKQFGSALQGHPDMLKTPGIEAPTGSLGMGLSFANGIALAARLDGLRFKLYVLLGDGEIQEGQIWEAAMNSSHNNLSNICVIIDRNKLQSQGEVDKIKNVEPLVDKWRAFGWDALRLDGHDVSQLLGALDSFDGPNGKPLAIIADTTKGKGVSFMENNFTYHNNSITEDEYRRAIEELERKVTALKGR